LPYADSFTIGEGDAAIGLFVWEMPAERDSAGFESASLGDWKVWAQQFCSDVGASSCDGFPQQAMRMCQNEGGGTCRSAILVPTADAQYAFFVDWPSAMIVGADPDQIRIVVVAREDGFPPAARYGGSVELLRSILTTMNVWTPGQQPAS
jgi:hypothetical protein